MLRRLPFKNIVRSVQLASSPPKLVAIPVRLFSENGTVVIPEAEQTTKSEEKSKKKKSNMRFGDYFGMAASTFCIVGLISYFVKISKEGKRLDKVKNNYREKCPLTAVESRELVSENNINITFFNYLCHLLKKEYPSEMTVSEFVGIMTDILQAGGIDHIEYGYHLERLFERLQAEHCPLHETPLSNDNNTTFVDRSKVTYYQDSSELAQVKLPVKLLLVAVLHIIQGDTDERLKALYRLFKENDSKRMTREEFETCVGYLVETYHLPVDYLSKKVKGFPLNDYVLASPQNLVDRALKVREEKSKIPMDQPISRKEYLAMITDRPLCIWGECYPVSQEEQKRLDEEKKQKEEIEKMKQKELQAMKLALEEEAKNE